MDKEECETLNGPPARANLTNAHLSRRAGARGRGCAGGTRSAATGGAYRLTISTILHLRSGARG